ncbi:MAG: rhodanese-like domain-containing protein [Bacilli bacterium]|nr:rhodanese-like domain-containing protein [Bacilli bacterium]
MKKIVIMLIVCILLVGCGSRDKSTLDEVLKSGNYIILDVRTNEEYSAGHVKDALNIPYDEIDDEVNLDKNKVILVYCKSGVRSSKALSTLKNLGYDVINLGAYDSITLEKE